MNRVELTLMTPEMNCMYFKGFCNDPAVYADPKHYEVYIYSDEKADAYWQKQRKLGRIHLAVIIGANPIGEVILKNLDQENRCTLSIHLQNDSVKNKGYGTEAEMLTLRYAFCTLGMRTVYADTLLSNTRSQHVLEKVGFQEIRRDQEFIYYRCCNECRLQPGAGQS